MGHVMNEIKAGFVVFATDDTREGIMAAREWVKGTNLTPELARLYRHNGQALVELLKPCAVLHNCVDTTPPP